MFIEITSGKDPVVLGPLPGGRRPVSQTCVQLRARCFPGSPGKTLNPQAGRGRAPGVDLSLGGSGRALFPGEHPLNPLTPRQWAGAGPSLLALVWGRVVSSLVGPVPFAVSRSRTSLTVGRTPGWSPGIHTKRLSSLDSGHQTV